MKPSSLQVRIMGLQDKLLKGMQAEGTRPSRERTEITDGPGLMVLDNPIFRQVLVNRLSVGNFHRDDMKRTDFSYWVVERKPHFDNLTILFSRLREETKDNRLEGERFRNVSFLCSYLELILGRLDEKRTPKPILTEMVNSCVEAYLFVLELGRDDPTIFTSKVIRLVGRLRTLFTNQHELLSPDRILEIVECELEAKSVFFYLVNPLVDSFLTRPDKLTQNDLIPRVLVAMAKNPILFTWHPNAQKDHPDAAKVLDVLTDLFIRRLST